MGYAHYWDMPAEVAEENKIAAIAAIKLIVKKYKKTLAFEFDKPKEPPMVDLEKGIRFNGIGDNGRETFMVLWKDTETEYCKTYDGIRFDAFWDRAIDEVKGYGFFYRGWISNRREPYCDLGMILSGQDGKRWFDHEGYEVEKPIEGD